MKGKSIAERAKHAKTILRALEKASGAQLPGIHSHADLDRIRDLLSSGKERNQTIKVLSLILCDNADVQDFDLLIDSNLIDLIFASSISKSARAEKSRLIRDSLMEYVRKSGGLALFLNEFETCYSAQTEDEEGWDLREMDERCKR